MKKRLLSRDLPPSPVHSIRALEDQAGNVFRLVPVSSLARSPFQPRASIPRDEAFSALVTSVNANGVLQPVVARGLPDGTLELLAGERRLEAAKACGHGEIPTHVLTDVSDTDARCIALTENLARAGLSAWEESVSLRRFFQLRGEQGLENDVRTIASVVGLSKSAVAERLSIAEKLTEQVRDAAGCKPGALEGLSKAVLLQVAKLSDPKARALKLKAQLDPTTITSEVAPFVVRGSETTVMSIRLARPVGAFSASEAAALLTSLRPLVAALEDVARQ